MTDWLIDFSSKNSDREKHWKETHSQSQREREELLERESMLQAQISDLQEEIRLVNTFVTIIT